METIVIKNVKFEVRGNKVVVADCDKNTKVKYTIRCNLFNTNVYYDLISIYNLTENWLVNIPVPIFVKEIAPFTYDQKTKAILKSLDETLRTAKNGYEQSELYTDFWKNIDISDIDFLRLFVLNIDSTRQYSSLEEYEEKNDESYLSCYLSRDELDDIRQKVNRQHNKKYFEEHIDEFKELDFVPNNRICFYENILNTTLEEDDRLILWKYEFYSDFTTTKESISVHLDEETGMANCNYCEYGAIRLEELFDIYKVCKEQNTLYELEEEYFE